eukprot:11114025-Alexandrium_andersonii.AAC.1
MRVWEHKSGGSAGGGSHPREAARTGGTSRGVHEWHLRHAPEAPTRKVRCAGARAPSKSQGAGREVAAPPDRL